MDYEKAYKEALERAREFQKSKDGLCVLTAESIFPELKESEDEKIRKAIISVFTGESSFTPKEEAQKYVAWLEKQGNKIVDYQQNHQDIKYPNGGIVMEDFNGGEGFYKLNLDYLSKKQVEEVEEMVRTWNKESKISNENIINCIGMCLTDVNEQRFKDYGTNLKDCLDWLEKQGEQNPIINVPTREVILAIWDLGNEWKELTDGDISTEYGTQLDYIQKHWHESEYYLREKQGEKKATDKVEPKFENGQWIVWKSQYYKVNDNGCGYELIDQNGLKTSLEYSTVDENAHIFTTQDAKPGDVLYSLDSKQPFIFKHRKPNEQAAVYCGINTYGKFFIGNTKDCVITTDKYIPADKFQRDLLFKKMQKAGYEWDAEKKELKLLISNGGDFESNNSKQKPTWSEEDEKMYRMCVDAVEYYHTSEDESVIRDWLISLKERLS